METKVNYAAVGAFVLVLSCLLIAGVLWLATGGAMRQQYDTYLALVGESVAGLNLNAPVKYRGVDVGRVREIALDSGNPQQVRLVFAIERGTPIKEDTEAVLKTQGLTGIAYVELDGGSASSPPLRAVSPALYPSIRTRPSLAARLENLLTTLMAKLDATSGGINRLLSEPNVAAFSNTLADLSTLARNEWVDTPARMLAPLLVAAIAESGAFRAVARVPSTATGALRLDTEVLVLQQEFLAKPSRVRFALRAELVADASREVIASRVFEAEVAASAEAPYAGVVAANLAVRDVLERLAAFCAEAAAGWKAPP